MLQEHAMKRRNMSPRKHARRFTKARRQTKAINSPAFIMRGGIRL